MHIPGYYTTLHETHHCFLPLPILFVVRHRIVWRDIDWSIGSVVKRHAHKY